jgi:hypothetical protein
MKFFRYSIINKPDVGAISVLMKKGEQLRIRIGTSFSSLKPRREIRQEIGTKGLMKYCPHQKKKLLFANTGNQQRR